MQLAAIQRRTQRAAGRQQVPLARKLVDVPRPHAIGQRPQQLTHARTPNSFDSSQAGTRPSGEMTSSSPMDIPTESARRS